MAYTSSKAFAGQGTVLAMGDGASAETFTTVAEVRNIQRSGAKVDLPDVTNMDSVGAYREYIATLLDAGDLSFTGNYIPNDSSQQALQTSFDDRARKNWKVTLPATSVQTPGNAPGFWSFQAIVSSYDFDLSVDKEATISCKLKITGKPSFTAEAAV